MYVIILLVCLFVFFFLPFILHIRTLLLNVPCILFVIQFLFLFFLFFVLFLRNITRNVKVEEVRLQREKSFFSSIPSACLDAPKQRGEKVLYYYYYYYVIVLLVVSEGGHECELFFILLLYIIIKINKRLK